MILKLTNATSGSTMLVDTTGIAFHPVDCITSMFNIANPSDTYWSIQETIEEIEQQIKDGGITNVT